MGTKKKKSKGCREERRRVGVRVFGWITGRMIVDHFLRYSINSVYVYLL